MSEATLISQEKVTPKTRRRPNYLGGKRNKVNELNDLNSYLKTIFQNYKVEVHVNGLQYPTAVCTIDLGTPLVPFEILPDQMAEINQRLKKVVAELGNNSAKVSFDSINNVFYASI